MKLKISLALLALSSLVFVGPACNRASYGADDPKKIHVGIVFDIGGKDDRSFNAAAWVGVKCAETGKRPDGGPVRTRRVRTSRHSTSCSAMWNREIPLQLNRRCAPLLNEVTIW